MQTEMAPDFLQIPPLPQENELVGYDVLGGAERILEDTNQDAYAGFTLDNENFGFTDEANQLAYEQAMAVQDLDVLGMLDYNADDADSVAQSERVMSAFNFVNLTAESLSTDGLLAEVARRHSIFYAERAAEESMRLASQEDSDEDDE